MARTAVFALLISLIPFSTGNAAGWADDLFPIKQHDFGKVARGEKPTYDFLLTNEGNREVRIKAIRVSCSCTTAMIANGRIASGESSIVTTTMDTSGFQGTKSVTIYVQLDRPWRAEVVLRVSCESVGKLGSEATEVDFGITPQGAKLVRRLNLDYTGPLEWKVLDLDFGNPTFRTEVAEIYREPGKIRYELSIALSESAPPGAHEDLIRVHTNDSNTPVINVKAKAQVEADVVVSPATIRLGEMTPGNVVERKVLIKAAQPFKVIRVDNGEGLFEFKTGQESKTVQLVTLTMKAPPDSQEIPHHVDIVTDLGGERILSVDIEK